MTTSSGLVLTLRVAMVVFALFAFYAIVIGSAGYALFFLMLTAWQYLPAALSAAFFKSPLIKYVAFITVVVLTSVITNILRAKSINLTQNIGWTPAYVDGEITRYGVMFEVRSAILVSAIIIGSNGVVSYLLYKIRLSKRTAA